MHGVGSTTSPGSRISSSGLTTIHASISTRSRASLGLWTIVSNWAQRFITSTDLLLKALKLIEALDPGLCQLCIDVFRVVELLESTTDKKQFKIGARLLSLQADHDGRAARTPPCKVPR
jgi:hypothetical protein